jgi:hypothetical protein
LCNVVQANTAETAKFSCYDLDCRIDSEKTSNMCIIEVKTLARVDLAILVSLISKIATPWAVRVGE